MPGSMYYDWVQAYRLQHCNLWTVPAKGGDSMAWKRMLQVRDEVCLHLGPVGARQVPGMPRNMRVQLVYE